MAIGTLKLHTDSHYISMDSPSLECGLLHKE